MISDFKAGTKVCQAVLLRVQKIGNSSNGGVFARGLLEDNSGKMPFIVFEAGIVDKMRSMEGPKVMMVGGMVDINKFSNDMTLQLVLQRMEEIMPEDDITHLLPNGDFDHQEYENKLQKLIKGLDTPLQIIERYRPCQEDNLIFPNLNYWSICKSLKKGMKECG